MKVSYITCTWNHSKWIKGWYDTLRRQMPKDVKFEFIVVDNASSDDTVAIARNFPDTKVILLDKNLGEGPGFNKAMKEATGDYIFKSDPDVYFTGPFYNDMVKWFKYSEVGVVVGHNPGWEELKRPGLDYIEVYLIPGAFFCLNRETIDKVGYWESGLPYSGAEFDYTARCRMKQVKIVRAFVPNDKSDNIKHCGRFQVTPDKALIPKEFGEIQEKAWHRLWAGGIGCCYWYILRGWLVPEDQYRLEGDKTKIEKVHSLGDLDRGSGYLGNWGR